MKNIFGLLLFLGLLTSCNKQSNNSIDNNSILFFNDNLIQIDSLMQNYPDSALMLLIEPASFVKLDECYWNLLLSEALYKNDNPQLNRSELLNTIPFFDSIYNSNPNNQNIIYLTARSHYINGVGYYENDSAADACKEYYKALEIMKPINGYSKFMSLINNRLANVYSDKFLIDPAIFFYKNTLYFKKQDGNSKIANTLFFIGYEFEKGEQNDSAIYYYNLSIENIPDTNSLLYRNVLNRKAITQYLIDNDGNKAINTLKKVITSGDDYEKYDRFLSLGYIYSLENQYDSALYYLNYVFNNAPDLFLRTQSANHLNEIYEHYGDTLKSSYYSRFITQNTPAEFATKADEWQLTNMFQDYLSQKQQEILLSEQQKSRQKVAVILIAALALIIIITRILIFRRRKKIYAGFDDFIKELVCQHILKTAHEQQFKSKIDCQVYKDYALNKEQMLNLRASADNHLNGFTERIKKEYAELTNDDIDYCLLYLLGMKESDIAAFMQKAYSTVSDRGRKLKKIFGSEQDLLTFLRNFAIK